MPAFQECHFICSLPDKDKDAIFKAKLPSTESSQAWWVSEGAVTKNSPKWTLYKLQEQLLEVAGSLASLWADISNLEVDLRADEVLRLLQRALVSQTQELPVPPEP